MWSIGLAAEETSFPKRQRTALSRKLGSEKSAFDKFAKDVGL